MGISALPPELIHIIVESLQSTRSALHALSLTCKQLNSEATRRLYASMMDHDASDHHRFLQAFKLNPQLALLVRVYHLPKREDTEPGYIWEYVRESLLLMVNLKELLIRRPFPSHSKRILPIVKEGDPAPFQLERFICLTSSRHYIPKDMAGFLSLQHNLKYLGWDTSGSLPGVLPESLTCVSGTSFSVRQALCRKPSIRQVRLNIRRYARSQQNVQLLELEAFHRLHILRLCGGTESGILKYICDLNIGPFINLRVLILSTSLPLEDPDVLRRFPRLSELIIMTRPGFDISPTTLAGLQNLVDALFRKLENLLSMDIRLENGQQYRRWFKGQLLPGYFNISKEELLDY